jgi:hypothetical protein
MKYQCVKTKKNGNRKQKPKILENRWVIAEKPIFQAFLETSPF